MPKPLSTTAFVLATAVSTCAMAAPPNSPMAMANASAASTTVQREVRTVGPFSSIALMTAADVHYTVSATPSVVIAAPAALLPQMTVSIERAPDGYGVQQVLRIGALGTAVAEKSVQVFITGPSPQLVYVAGAGPVAVTGVDGEQLTVVLNGAGNLTLDGRNRTLRAEVNGSGQLDAARLLAADVQLEIQGAGNVQLQASHAAAVASRGAGHVTITGQPSVRQVVQTGSGRVEFR